MEADSDTGSAQAFTSTWRKDLFLKIAAEKAGTTPAEVHKAAVELGDSATEEAYYNIARRLAHRGLLCPVELENKKTQYKVGAPAEERWLEEDDLSGIIDPDYPFPAITIWDETRRHINELKESLWIELRERLKGKPAVDLFYKAIASYADDLHAQIQNLVRHEDRPTGEITGLRMEAENSCGLLFQFAKYGLGLSAEAVNCPFNVDSAIQDFKHGNIQAFVNEQILREELKRRIADEPLLVEEKIVLPENRLMIGAVDGSTRGGLLSFLGEEGDLNLGYAPMVSINTSIGQVDRALRLGIKNKPVFFRLPEKPEDMQRGDNRYTMMAKLFYPDMSDAEYMHSAWNAMDVIEAKATLRLMSRWDLAKDRVEIPAADVVLRDGTVSPQDRDFHHYSDLSSYGKIVRDMIDTNWKIALKCREEGQTVAGVVKNSQLRIFGPVINWFATRVAQEKSSQLESWPLKTMNLLPDQLVLTRLLTAGRAKGEPWVRTCVVIRPFHSTTNFSRTYSRAVPVSQRVLELSRQAKENPEALDQDKRIFWETLFREANDPYVKMLDNLHYASFFLGAVPQLDTQKTLPRFEFIVPASTRETDNPPLDSLASHLKRLLMAVCQTGFDVSAEHSMFDSRAKLDVLPSILIRAHDTVKLWATELLSRVQEYIGYFLSRYVKSKRHRGIKVRPFTGEELKLLYEQLREEREQQAGARGEDRMLEK